MAWRLIQDRLPTRDNLRRRRIIELQAAICCCCNAASETAKHLFVECLKVSRLWYRIVGWVGANWAPPREMNDHLSSFKCLLGNGKNKKRMGGLWICVTWVMWRWQNMVIHKHKEWDFKKVEEEIKGRFWSWHSAKGAVDRNIRYVDWMNRKLMDSWVV